MITCVDYGPWIIPRKFYFQLSGAFSNEENNNNWRNRRLWKEIRFTNINNPFFLYGIQNLKKLVFFVLFCIIFIQF